MLSPQTVVRTFLFVLVTCFLSVGNLPFTTSGSVRASASATANPLLFRTRISLERPLDAEILRDLNVLVLDQNDLNFTVLVEAGQLEVLTQRQFKPRQTEDLAVLIETHRLAYEWLATSLDSLLQEAEALQPDLDALGSRDARVDVLATLQPTLHALTLEQKTGIVNLIGLDDDGDGLTNTEEAFWCTNPTDPNTDDDVAGKADGEEVNAVLNPSLPANERRNYGPPFGPPAAWPDFNGADGNPVTPACNDGDRDTIPDYAEAYYVGTRVGTGDSENTDGDKFDDGQELFYTTYCGGGSSGCSYGAFPRAQDSTYFTAGMPTWVRPPGDSPFVAAYPVMEMAVNSSSVRVVTREIRTIERTITQGEEIATGFAETEGNATTVGTIDTNSHSTWQEQSTTEGGIEPGLMGASFLDRIEPAPQIGDSLNYDSDTQWRTQPAVQKHDVTFVAGTVEPSEGVEAGLQEALQYAPLAPAYAVTNLYTQTNWLFVSVVGLTQIPDDNDWQLDRDMLWFGLVLLEQKEGAWRGAVEGTHEFTDLLQSVPTTILDESSKIGIDPLQSQQQMSQPYGFPWDSERSSEFGNKGVHFAGFNSWTGSDWASVDFLSNSTDAGMASDQVYAVADRGIVGPICTDSYTVAFKIGDLIYLHLLTNPNIHPGADFDQGDPIGRLKHGSFPPEGQNAPCGHAKQGANHYHLHLGFPDTGALVMGGWTLTWDKEKVKSPDIEENRDKSAKWRQNGQEVGINQTLLNSLLNNPTDQIACLAPIRRSTDVNPRNLPGQSWVSKFKELLGVTLRGWQGPTATSSNFNLVSGCNGNSCSAQVRGSSDYPYNFSDNRSAGQCGTGGLSTPSSSSGNGAGGGGIAINANGDGTFDRLRVWSETSTTGAGNSTSHSEVRSETNYREITRSTVNTLVSSEAWSTATTVDPTNAGTLTFNFSLTNIGSDVAVNLTEMDINILIGDLPVITWRAPDQSDILPTATGSPVSGGPIILTLEQVAAIDNGAPIRVVLANYDYDDNLYEQNAWGQSVLFHVDDGIADGNRSVDTYLVTTDLFNGETYQDTLARYFPVEVFDAGSNDERTGTLTNITTPEFDSSGYISAWQERPVTGNAWWELSISEGGETDGIEHFRDMPAKPRTDVYLKYIVDTDSDGYSDIAELEAGTDPQNAGHHPRPILIAAQHTAVVGNTATVQVALQNNGNYDASSVELWAIALDDSITINDNLVGGGGRVRAGSQIVVGSLIAAPDLTGWPSSTSKPYLEGQFEGTTPLTFTVRADTSGTVGSSAGLTVSWRVNQGAWTAVNVGSGYVPYSPLSLANGVKVAFTPGTMIGGEQFTVVAIPPLDTFSYTINRTPYTPPMVVVSYNDAQGNHKFTSDVEIDRIQADLTAYQGLMRTGLSVEMVATTSMTPGANTAYVIFNNTTDHPIMSGKLFVEFALLDGTVAKEYVLANQTFAPGPNVVEVAWNTADFTPAYDPNGEYYVLVFATDRQDTIIENAVKPLAVLGTERLPQIEGVLNNWDVGAVAQGTIRSAQFKIANTGFGDLLAHVSAPPELAVSYLPDVLLAADMATIEVTLNTSGLPAGPYSAVIELRSSDVDASVYVIQVSATITDSVPETSIEWHRPLDVQVAIPGDHPIYEWVTFTVPFVSDPVASHPLHVYRTGESTLQGVGRYVADSANNLSLTTLFGDGMDAPLMVPANTTVVLNQPRMQVAATGTTATPSASTGFANGDLVLFHQTQGTTNQGRWEYAEILSINSATSWTLKAPLTYSYTSSGGKAQVIRVPQYSEVTIQSGGILKPPAWNGSTGGILAFKASGRVLVAGTIDGSGAGYPGGIGGSGDHESGFQGASELNNGARTWTANGSGGGGGAGDPDPESGSGGGGAGGGHLTSGINGETGHLNQGGQGGAAIGTPSLERIYFGGAGGGGGADDNGPAAGRGGTSGGIVIISAFELELSGALLVNGAGGGGADSCSGAGGGGAGGSLFLQLFEGNLGNGLARALGGARGDAFGCTLDSDGGDGSHGRIRVEHCAAFTGTTLPEASTQQLPCYITEQIETPPYTQARLQLPVPENNGSSYTITYGLKYEFPAPAHALGTTPAQSATAPVATTAVPGYLNINPQALHPVRIYEAGSDTLLGVGRYATELGQGTGAVALFGNGRDGDLVVNPGETRTINTVRAPVTASGTSATIFATAPFTAGDLVLFHQTYGGINAGRWEFNRIVAIHANNTWTLATPLLQPYGGGSTKAQVVQIPQYENVTVPTSGTLTAPAWNGATGGILAFLANGDVLVEGTVSGTGIGYRGATRPVNAPRASGRVGESYQGVYDALAVNQSANYSGGGGAYNNNADAGSGGGGGGYATNGGAGAFGHGTNGSGPGYGGGVIGEPSLSPLAFFGGGGGSGSNSYTSGGGNDFGGAGGTGGGFVLISGDTVTVTGTILANGANGVASTGHATGGGGGGAAGSVLIRSRRAELNATGVRAGGGVGGQGGAFSINGGTGGTGRIRVEYCDVPPTGTTSPTASLAQIRCYIAEQVETPPYDQTRFNLPTGISDGTAYNVQYGMRYEFAASAAVLPSQYLTHTVRIEAGAWQSATLEAIISGVGSGPMTLEVDIGANGSVDWTTTGVVTGTTQLNSPDLAQAFNTYWQDHGSPSGTIDVPIRVGMDKAGQVLLTNLAMLAAYPDLSISSNDIAFSAPTPPEGDFITITATIHNGSLRPTSLFSVAFYADLPARGRTYLGSDLVGPIPAGGNGPASILWDTLGFVGAFPITVVADPFGRMLEAETDNNLASKPITILTRPDLNIASISLNRTAPVADEPLTVTVVLSNTGQTASGNQHLVLYQGEPDAGGVLIGEVVQPVPAEATTTLQFPWVVPDAGPLQLVVVADEYHQVRESNEHNNRTTLPVYIGLRGPVLLDSGDLNEPFYTPALGYGVIDADQNDITGTCGTRPDESYRLAADGDLVYQFDHLVPGRYYHLDVVMYTCGFAERSQSISVNALPQTPPVFLPTHRPVRVSLLLDPALYTTNAITVAISSDSEGTIVNEVHLYDVDYRYRDAGGPGEPGYPNATGFGFLTGQPANQGMLPYQTERRNAQGNSVEYRADQLRSDKVYNVQLTFWQASGQSRVHKVQVDGRDTGLTVTTVAGQAPQRFTLTLPPSAYEADGSAVIAVVRTNATSGAAINEIAIEEETLNAGPLIREVRVSDIRNTQAVLTWLTDRPAIGDVRFGTNPAALNTIGFDTRGTATTGETHQVLLSGLQPLTTYYFTVRSGQTVGDNNGVPYSFTTGPSLGTPPTADSISGRVLNRDGTTPAVGSLVFVRVRDSNASGSNGISAPLVAMTGASGTWSMNLRNARTGTLGSYFNYSPTGDTVEVEVFGGTEGIACKSADTAADTPVADMVLGDNCLASRTLALQTSWNFVALPVQPVTSYTADTLCFDIAEDGGAIAEVNQLVNNGWEPHLCAIPENDFAIALGRGYFVRSFVPSTWHLEGLRVTEPVSVPIEEGWNTFSILHTEGYSAATVCSEMRAQGIQALEIDRWDGGGWDSHLCDIPVNNFAIQSGQGYFVRSATGGTYTPLLSAWAPGVVEEATDISMVSGPLARPMNLEVANLSDAGATVSWTTEEATVGYVIYETQGREQRIAYDRRSATYHGRTHIVNIPYLEPATTYSITVVSGIPDTKDEGATITFTTLPAGGPIPLTDVVVGQAMPTNDQPNSDLLVTVRIVSDPESDAGRSLRSALLVTYSGTEGYWLINLGNARDESATPFGHDRERDFAEITYRDGQRVWQETVKLNTLLP